MKRVKNSEVFECDNCFNIFVVLDEEQYCPYCKTRIINLKAMKKYFYWSQLKNEKKIQGIKEGINPWDWSNYKNKHVIKTPQDVLRIVKDLQSRLEIKYRQTRDTKALSKIKIVSKNLESIKKYIKEQEVIK